MQGKIPNSPEQRDAQYQMHPLVDLVIFKERSSLIIDRGEGIYVFDNSGKRYIEGLSGLWSVGVGYGQKRLSEAAVRQMDKLPYYHLFNYKSHEPSIDLAEKLVSISPDHLTKVHFTSSGSEANDLVMKMVWYRSNAMGQPQRKKIVGRINGYHGVTIATAALSGISRFHQSFDLPMDRVRHTLCPDFEKNALPGETEAEFTARLLTSLEDLILAEGPETIAAMWGEPVIGGGGVILPPTGYWQGVQQILRKYNILLVADEVICGFGRTGRMFGSQKYDIRPDVMVLSKQLSSSYIPLSAIVMSDDFLAPIEQESHRLGTFAHGFTASGHPVAAAVGLENIRLIEELGLVENVARLEGKFLSGLKHLASHPKGRSSRGVGLIGAVELRSGASLGETGLIAQDLLLEEGVICRVVGDALCFCPPMIITEAQIDELFAAVERAIDRLPG